jgi:hypothetical protein
VLEDENPLVREWNRALEQQIEAAAAQVDRIKKTAFQASLKDAAMQRFYDDLVRTYVVASILKSQRLQMQLDRVFSSAGPQAIPALVRGVNLSLALGIGFT